MIQYPRNYQFSFEKLDVYQNAIQFTNKVFSITLMFRREMQSSLGDQFRRASLSICNNLAEGSDKQSCKSKIQFYGYALDSARECIPIITVATDQNQITMTVASELRERCISICNMTARLIRSVK